MKKLEMDFVIKVPEEDVFGNLKEKNSKNEITNFVFTRHIKNVDEEVFIPCDEYGILLYEIDNSELTKLLNFVNKESIHSGIKGLLFFLIQNDFKLLKDEVILGTTRKGNIISVVYRKDKYFFDIFNPEKKEKRKNRKYYLITLDIMLD